MTIGEEALKLQEKTDEKTNPIEMQREMHKSFEEEFTVCFERGKKTFEGDFFITVLFKKERHLQNIVRQYFIPRASCPTPDFDQSVWHYHKKSDELEFLWTIPDSNTCSMLMLNSSSLPLEYLPMLQYVEEYACGKLDILARNLNKEGKEE